MATFASSLVSVTVMASIELLRQDFPGLVGVEPAVAVAQRPHGRPVDGGRLSGFEQRHQGGVHFGDGGVEVFAARGQFEAAPGQHFQGGALVGGWVCHFFFLSM